MLSSIRSMPPWKLRHLVKHGDWSTSICGIERYRTCACAAPRTIASPRLCIGCTQCDVWWMLFEGVLTVELAGRVSRPRVCLHQWAHQRPANTPARVWSAGQQRLLDAVSTRAFVQDANELEMQKVAARYVHVSGLPGCGKTEAMVYSAHCLAIDHGLHVAVACPTGVLVSLYSERLPETEHITVQTTHSLLHVGLKQDPAAYMLPGRRRSFDAFCF